MKALAHFERVRSLATGAAVVAILVIASAPAMAAYVDGRILAAAGAPNHAAQMQEQPKQEEPQQGAAPAPRVKRPERSAPGEKPQLVTRQLDLPPDKADAVFDLLSPRDVPVLVRRTDKGVSVRGTTGEVHALVKLAELLTREQGQAIEGETEGKLSKAWNAQASFSGLNDQQADALFRTLAFKDVPVLVSRHLDEVTVAGSRQDVDVVKDVVKIIRGKSRPENAEAEPRQRNAQRNRQNAEQRARQEAQRAQREEQRRAVDEQRQALEQQLRELHDDVDRRTAELQEQARMLREEVERLKHEVDERSRQLAEQLEQVAGQQEQPHPRAPEEAGEMVERSYELTPPHADDLFRLLAPPDVKDVLVSRRGNVIIVRATPRDQKAIQGMVDILNRDD